ncbi:unnamed protein product [Tilletia caries]|nr:unnamed protein product [Tilletia caries]
MPAESKSKNTRSGKTTSSKTKSKSQAQTQAETEDEGGVDDALDAFLDEYLKVSFKKQRAEAAKFAKDLKAGVERGEGNAVSHVGKTNQDLYKTLNPSEEGGELDDDAVEQAVNVVNHVLQTVTDLLEVSNPFDRTLVDGDAEGDEGEEGVRPSVELLSTIDVALAERPRQLMHHARKVVKKHNAEQTRRAERKEVGANARALIRQFTDGKI